MNTSLRGELTEHPFDETIGMEMKKTEQKYERAILKSSDFNHEKQT